MPLMPSCPLTLNKIIIMKTLKCKTRAEFERVCNWLCASGIAYTARVNGLEIEIGVQQGMQTLPMYQSSVDSFNSTVRFSECLASIKRGAFNPMPATLDFFKHEADLAILNAKGEQ